MQNHKTDILIIGAGLTGLTLGYYLKLQKTDFRIVEARARLGGRIWTDYQEGQAPIDHGATWLGKKHTALFDLLKDLEIDVFAQALGDTAIYEPISTSPHQLVQLPPNDEPSFRIQNGTFNVINTLAEKIELRNIHLNQTVLSIDHFDDELVVKTKNEEWQAKKVISTLPPKLFVSKIQIIPKLPDRIFSLANTTHTWMGESIKIALKYKAPFWRSKHLSGTIFSNVGPIPEMYDHSDYLDQSYALKGFLNGNYFSISKEQRLEIILNQLRKYFGEAANSPMEYQETVWRKEPLTFEGYDQHILPHQNNGHELYKQSFMQNKLYIAGSETANAFPGYMEGAVRSAQYIFAQLQKK